MSRVFAAHPNLLCSRFFVRYEMLLLIEAFFYGVGTLLHVYQSKTVMRLSNQDSNLGSNDGRSVFFKLFVDLNRDQL